MSPLSIPLEDPRAAALACMAVVAVIYVIRWYTDPVSAPPCSHYKKLHLLNPVHSCMPSPPSAALPSRVSRTFLHGTPRPTSRRSSTRVTGRCVSFLVRWHHPIILTPSDFLSFSASGIRIQDRAPPEPVGRRRLWTAHGRRAPEAARRRARGPPRETRGARLRAAATQARNVLLCSLGGRSATLVDGSSCRASTPSRRRSWRIGIMCR